MSSEVHSNAIFFPETLYGIIKGFRGIQEAGVKWLESPDGIDIELAYNLQEFIEDKALQKADAAYFKTGEVRTETLKETSSEENFEN